jgi:choline monooxygenase
MTEIDDDIRRARTRPGSDYGDPAVFAHEVSAVLARSWLSVPAPPDAPGWAEPHCLLPGALDEPVLCTRDGSGQVHWMSNVCTHRGMTVVCEAGPAKRLRCVYHGRRFGLDGRLQAAPGFEDAADFPQPIDDLPGLAQAAWGPLHFVSLDPPMPAEDWLAPLRQTLGFMPLDALVASPQTSRDYEIAANWALYVDNYLEGFHIPTVHKGLARALDVAAYETRLAPSGSLQVGMAAEGEPSFELPPGHADAGRQVAAYYLHLFPTTMVNAYPWGLSVNRVEPMGPRKTRVRFVEYLWRPELRDSGAGAALHQVELEDEAIVEQTQLGVRSRLYTRGRYAPRHEQAVHHFHRMLSAASR